MKTKSTKLDEFLKLYSHPSVALFRAIELRSIHENCKDLDFIQPSLDLGCGDGEIAKILFDDKFTYGVDNGEAKDVEEAIKNKVYQKVFLESAEKMSLPNNSVDFVFSNCVIEHIPAINSVLSEVGRILKPGGMFVFTTPSHKFSDFLFISNKLRSFKLDFLAEKYVQKRNRMLNHYNMHGHNGWKKKLKKNNMGIIKSSYYISKEALMLWDKMALEVFLRSKFSNNAEKFVLNKYKKNIKEIYQNPPKEKGGAAILVAARKY